MTPTTFRGAVRHLAVLVAVALLAGPVAAQQATTTGAIRGIVTGPDGHAIGGATVVITSEETGVRRGAQSDDAGRYQVPFLDPGLYTVRAQFIGFRPVERPGIRIAIGQVEKIDFRLEAAPTTLATQRVVAEATPLIETTKTGASTRIDQTQIRELPTNGRNFKDLVVLAPGTSDVGNVGSGGGQSIGGGRTGASNILMDGVNNNESFFGGDARGGDRAPFSYSIEAVKEIQVITAGYDVERGQYTGGTVNAVTKSGTNRYTGAAFGYLRQDEALGIELTHRDFLGRRPVDFKAQQYGFALGGPIIKDRMHFFFTLDKQTRNEPRPVFVDAGSGDAAVRANGINPDTLNNFLRIARDVYGWNLDNEVGQFAANTDESAFFGRIDWQLSNTHKLTIRDNYTKTDLSQDRLFVSPTSQDLLSDAGFNTDRANSFVASLQSVFGGGVSNEFRTQIAFEKKPRPSNPAAAFGVPMPEVRVNNIPSALSDGSLITTGIRFGADPILHANNIEEETYEVIDNLRWARGDHTFKFGVNGLKVHAYNLFFNNGLGTFQFNSMAEFEAGTPTSFQRTLPLPGQPIPVADYNVYETALYAQDEWQISPRFFINYGLRYDYGWFPDKPEFNPDLTAAFPYLDVRNQPNDRNNFSPRFGFTFDPGANGTQVIRGGTGIFYGRSPYVLWSNALLATGVTQLSLNCTSSNGVPTPDFPAYAADPSTIPTVCSGGGGAAAATPTVMVFAKNYEQSYAWKSNLGYDRLIAENWRFGVEGVYSTVRDNYILQDDNFNPVPRFRIEGNIPVFVDPSTISTTNGSVNRINSRRNSSFDQVLVERSLGSTLTYQGIVSLNGRMRWGQMYASYTYDNSRDNGSLGCCTTGTMFANGRVAGDVNNFDDQWGPSDWNRRHTLVLAPQFTLPYGFKGSAIFRYFSGLSYTPRYNFDINGDGASNDRAYIPTAAEVQSQILFAGATAEEQSAQRSLLEQKVGGSSCLREHRGEIATRNMCRSGPNKVLDARIAKQFTVVGGQSLELQADFFNVLNGLNPKWGRRLEVQEANSALLIPSGFDPATNRYRYRVNTDFGRRAPAVNFQTAQFQMQLGLRYNF